jgi:hypothetical protein
MLQDNTVQDASDEQILHPGSRQLFRHWEMLRAERACPTREEFELSAVKGILPDMFIMDRDYLRSSFKFRLAGTRICTLFNRNLTGTNAIEGWDKFESEVLSRHLLIALNQKQPVVIRMRFTTERQQVVAAEMVALPVQMRNSHRTQLIGGLFPFRAAQSLGHTSITKQELASARVVWTEHIETEATIHHIQVNRQDAPVLTLINGGRN